MMVLESREVGVTVVPASALLLLLGVAGCVVVLEIVEAKIT